MTSLPIGKLDWVRTKHPTEEHSLEEAVLQRDNELALIDELVALKRDGAAFLDAQATRNPVEHYGSEAHFQREQRALLRRVPLVAALGSELAQPGDFKRVEIAGLPVLLTRDRAGEVHAFLNVCRHRGTRLVDEEAGCKHRFSCPYHAWTYANTGELLAAPHFEEGWPAQQKSELGLQALPCQERFGFIWVLATQGAALDVDEWFRDLAADLAALGLDRAAVAVEHTEIRDANWKTLVEGGIESYHFRIAHRKTIGPHFEDNLSSYQAFGPHLRSILPRTSLFKLDNSELRDCHLRDHANVLYTLFPSCQLLVQQDHVVMVHEQPLSASQTRLRLATLVPQERLDDAEHWQRNHEITRATLSEDFAIGESIQAGVTSGANASMQFGRFEGALDRFNQSIAHYLGDAGA